MLGGVLGEIDVLLLGLIRGSKIHLGTILRVFPKEIPFRCAQTLFVGCGVRERLTCLPQALGGLGSDRLSCLALCVGLLVLRQALVQGLRGETALHPGDLWGGRWRP